MGKKIFSYGAPTKNAPLWIFVSYNFLRGDQDGFSLGFDHVRVEEDLYQIWCIIQNLHYGCAYTPRYNWFGKVENSVCPNILVLSKFLWIGFEE